MGVVKNLMVRVGADVRGVVNGMKSARSATAKASDGIKKSSKETKQSIIDAFTAPAKAVREYTTTVTETRAKHQAESQNVEVLKDKLTKLEETYGTIKNATDGLDLSKSLVQQISDTEKSLEGINAKIHKTQAKINAIGNPKSASKAARLESLNIELQNLMADSDAAAAHLSALDQAAAQIGPSNLGAASAAGLKQMEQEIVNTKNELTVAKRLVAELGAKLQSLKLGSTLLSMLKSVGSAAAQAAGNGIKKLGSALKNLAAGAVRGIASLPGKLLNIGKSASAGCGGIGKMVRSIRNIGIASLGMRVATGMFGRMRSIISSYIYQNEALNQSVTSLRNQMGEALAPAINIVMVAMQRLMPVVTAVSNVINSVFSALFGKAKSTSTEIASTAEAASDAAESLDVYGFDQITKVSDNSGGGSGGAGASTTQHAGEQSALVQKLTNWIKQLKAAFVAGDWAQLGKLAGDGISGAYRTATEWIRTVDWLQIGQSASDLIANVDWGELATDLFTLFGTALSAGVSVAWGFIRDAVGSIKEYFAGKIEECGGNVALGLLQGVLDGLGNIVIWVGEHVVTPFVNGFTSIKTGAENAFSGLWKGVSGWINKVIDGVEGMVNWVIKGINGLIDAFNGVAQVGTHFGLDLQIGRMSEVSLPRLAKGTVVDEPTVAMIGEAGKEVVMPLENNTGWITKLAQQINQAGGSKVTTLALAIYFRSRKLAEYVIQDINQIGKENGVCPIYV